MRGLVKTELDKVDELEVGRGMLDAYLFGAGTLDVGQVGLGVDYSHRIRSGLSAYAHGDLGYSYGNQSGLGWKALVGLRGRF